MGEPMHPLTLIISRIGKDPLKVMRPSRTRPITIQTNERSALLFLCVTGQCSMYRKGGGAPLLANSRLSGPPSKPESLESGCSTFVGSLQLGPSNDYAVLQITKVFCLSKTR